eukprot:scaffold75236_cov60-Phaeocystis_antarctica.AAC.2
MRPARGPRDAQHRPRGRCRWHCRPCWSRWRARSARASRAALGSTHERSQTEPASDSIGARSQTVAQTFPRVCDVRC